MMATLFDLLLMRKDKKEMLISVTSFGGLLSARMRTIKIRKENRLKEPIQLTLLDFIPSTEFWELLTLRSSNPSHFSAKNKSRRLK